MKKIILLSIFSHIIIGYSQENPFRILTQEEVCQDANVLQQSIHEGVIEAYWYVDSVEITRRIDSICSIEEGVSKLELFRFFSEIISSVGCSHTYINCSASFDNFFRDNHKYLPIGVRYIAGTTFITETFDNSIPEGSELISINKKNAETIKTLLLSRFEKDAKSITSRLRSLEDGQYPYYYKYFVDTSQVFDIKYKAPSGTKKTIRLNGISLDSTDTFGDFNKVSWSDFPYGFRIENNIAFLNIEHSGLDNYSEKIWSKFIKQCFKKIEESKIEHLVIDVRRNPGGWLRHQFHLMQYFCDTSFIPIEEAWQKSEVYPFFEFTDLKGKDYLHKKNRDYDTLIGNHGYSYLVGEEYKPVKKHFFNGQVYVLTSGSTFSAAAVFANSASVYNDAIFIGESPGGCFIGGSAGNSAELILPNSKISVTIALTFFKFPWFTYNRKGEFLNIDYQVNRTLTGDSIMDFTKELIKETIANREDSSD
jgi:hypothetical protein